MIFGVLLYELNNKNWYLIHKNKKVFYKNKWFFSSKFNIVYSSKYT